MLLIDQLVEQHIQKAVDNGDLDHLPGRGKRLDLDDDRNVPTELRAAYRMMKNAGFVPPELEDRRELARLETLVGQLEDDAERRRVEVRLSILKSRLDERGHGGIDAETERRYAEKLRNRLQTAK